MDKISRALHTKVKVDDADAVVTPLYQASAFRSSSPYFYTRKDNPNVRELENVIATLEEARFCVSTSTGMAAITNVLDLLSPDSIVVTNRAIYGCSYKLLQRLAARRRWRLLSVDLSEPEALSELDEGVDLVFFETPTNPFLKTIDISAVAERAHAANRSALVVVDNTWATPLFQQPLKNGADVSIHSATKYISGHSDVMGGFVLINDERLHEEIRSNRFYTGPIMDPNSAWLLRRSVQTLALRMMHHQVVTREMVEFLRELPQVTRVDYPRIDRGQLKGYGGIVFIQMREDLAPRYMDWATRLKLFDTGTGMACVTSMIAQPYTGSHASMSDDEKAAMGLDRGLVRLCFGMEPVVDLKEDLLLALGSLEGSKAVLAR